MKKNRIISSIMSGILIVCFSLGSFASSRVKLVPVEPETTKKPIESATPSSTTKSNASLKDPEDARERLNDEFEDVMDTLENSYYLTNYKDDFDILYDWIDVIDSMKDGIEISYKQSAIVLELGTKKWSDKSTGVTYNISETNNSLIYEIYGVDIGESYYSAETTTFKRTKDVVQTEIFYTDKNSKPLDSYIYFDCANGKNYMYMQQIEKVSSSSNNRGDYFAVRVMIGNGKMYSSVSYLSKSEVKNNRINGVYATFDDFAFNHKDAMRMYFDGEDIKLVLDSGRTIDYIYNGQ